MGGINPADWTPDRVLSASARIDYRLVPTDSIFVRTRDFDLIRFPDRLASSNFNLVQAWINSSSSFHTFEPAATQQARDWGHKELCWWIGRSTFSDTQRAVRARGKPCGSYQLLALQLKEQTTMSSLPPGVQLRVVDDRQTFEDAIRVSTEGWGRTDLDTRTNDRLFQEALIGLDQRKVIHVVAYVDGNAAATGRLVMFENVARLIGAITLPAFRHQGLYTSLLRERLRLGGQLAATLALTKAKPTTSGPILIKAGFREYDLEECFSLSL